MNEIKEIRSLKKTIGTFCLKGFELIPLSCVGVEIDYKEFFLPWLQEKKKEMSLTTDDVFEIFQKICEKNQLDDSFSWLTGNDLLILEDDSIFIGQDVDTYNPAFSKQRILIEMRKTLEKINILNEDDNPDIVYFRNDILMYKDEISEDLKNKKGVDK